MSKQFIRKGAKLESIEQTSIQRNTEIKYVLCVDVETLTDFSQKTRIGYYQVKNIETDTTLDHGLFYNIVTPDELALIKQYADKNGYKLFTLQEFVQKKLYPYVLNGVHLVNHNIAFDLGAMCTWYAPYGTNGFYLKLCDCSCKPKQVRVQIQKRGKPAFEVTTIIECSNHPNIIIRRLTSKKYTMWFDADNSNVGSIMDTSTIGRALLGPSGMSLKEMGKNFRCSIRKAEFDDYQGNVTTEYLDYMLVDVRATMNLFEREYEEYKKHGTDTPLVNILSEASIGKAYFKLLGIAPFMSTHDLPEWLYSIAMRAYYGARSEVKIRLLPTLIRYVDFKSQYPTVNALLHLQDLLLAERIEVKHVTSKARTLLATITVDDLQKKETWQQLRMLVKVKPNKDILPCRFEDGKQKGYAVCYVTSGENWYAMCDVVASKLLEDKVPEIIDAIELIPYGKIETNIIRLFSDDKYIIDLNKDDLFTRVIDLRTEIKKESEKFYDETKSKDMQTDEYNYYTSLQLALKLIANSTAYGILVETITHHGDEYAGKYYAVPIACHITSGARLLLALAEKLGMMQGLTYAMCDTDSMAYALPDGMEIEEFYGRVDKIVSWFTPLSPYATNVPIFEIEDVNRYRGKDEKLYFLGVSCKRYALYNKLANNQYRLRKTSAHATGRYMFDSSLPLPKQLTLQDVEFSCTEDDMLSASDETEETTDDELINAPTSDIKMWQYLVWYRGVELAELGIAPYIPDEEWSNNLARYQDTINTPDKLNRHKNLAGVRPYSFIVETPAYTYMKNGKEKKAKYRYAMPFNKTAKELKAGLVYRIDSGQIELFPTFDTLKDRFKTFFNHPEIKAGNGYDSGLLQRRHIIIDTIIERSRTGKVS